MKAFDYSAPTTVAEAVTLLAEKGDRARALAGGTDVIVQVREGRRDLDLLIDIKYIPELNELSFDPGKGLRFGAAVPCYRLCEHPGVARAYPGLIEAAGLIGGTQIQSRASRMPFPHSLPLGRSASSPGPMDSASFRSRRSAGRQAELLSAAAKSL
jgi:carbon-monoxide dehydrogenase medium subunit